MPHTPRLCLRPVTPDDVAPLTRLLAGDSAGIAMTARIPDPATEETTRAWVETVQAGGGRVFTVTLADSGEPVGVAGCVGDDDGPMPEIGYWIGRTHRRRGYGGEAVAALLAHLAERGARGAVAEVFPENAASLRLLRRLGFAETGSLERDMPLRGGLRRVLRLAIDGAPFR